MKSETRGSRVSAAQGPCKYACLRGANPSTASRPPVPSTAQERTQETRQKKMGDAQQAAPCSSSFAHIGTHDCTGRGTIWRRAERRWQRLGREACRGARRGGPVCSILPPGARLARGGLRGRPAVESPRDARGSAWSGAPGRQHGRRRARGHAPRRGRRHASGHDCRRSGEEALRLQMQSHARGHVHRRGRRHASARGYRCSEAELQRL